MITINQVVPKLAATFTMWYLAVLAYENVAGEFIAKTLQLLFPAMYVPTAVSFGGIVRFFQQPLEQFSPNYQISIQEFVQYFWHAPVIEVLGAWFIFSLISVSMVMLNRIMDDVKSGITLPYLSRHLKKQRKLIEWRPQPGLE